ncbi:MAG: CDP-diacylglycerol--glycerol-3-phosphate 3-phosphatidyltransferase [Actinomycetota bacterium]|nr:CDP-diacylglycerol--glycerol-3-phosphate 3-phosphatidyltransferase [Actinomycetota bacterium]
MKLPEFITPNFITVARLLFIPIGVYTLFKNGGDDATWQYLSWIVFFILGMSDILDGKLARSQNTITELGKFLDPLADKVMIAAAMISLSILDRLAWWVTIIILLREVGITLFRLSIIKRGVIAANKGGKIKSTLQNLAVGFYILPLGTNLYWFRDGFMGIAIILTIATGIYYVQSALRQDK